MSSKRLTRARVAALINLAYRGMVESVEEEGNLLAEAEHDAYPASYRRAMKQQAEAVRKEMDDAEDAAILLRARYLR